jgi:glutamine synthetase
MAAMAAIAQLAADGVVALVGTVVNPAGLVLAKTVPLARASAFAQPGLGASPVWHVFAIDQIGVVTGGDVGLVGDLRIRIDPDAVRLLGDGLAWAPGDFFQQDGSPDPFCSRGALRRVEERFTAAGFEALVGHEIECVLVGPDGARLPSALWAQYGLAGVLEHEGFVRDVIEASATCGVTIEQLHPEYGANQFEISLAPLGPVAAADQLVLMRIVIGRVARKHGVRASLSPVPFAGSVGSGAHQHFSLTQDGVPIFSGGAGPAGMTPSGESAVAGLLAGLPAAQGVLSGSIVSGLRMQPGSWAGAHLCWGTENREAAVRFVASGSADPNANPHGANVEVKAVDSSANPYFATAAILGLALDGIERNLPLPPEVTVNPAFLSAGEREAVGMTQLPSAQAEVIDALDGSALMRGILGDSAVDAVVAVRRYEHDTYADLTDDELTQRFRMSWSV